MFQIGLGMLQKLSAGARAVHLARLNRSQLLRVVFLIVPTCLLLTLSWLSPSGLPSGALAPFQVMLEALAQDLPACRHCLLLCVSGSMCMMQLLCFSVHTRHLI